MVREIALIGLHNIRRNKLLNETMLLEQYAMLNCNKMAFSKIK